MQVTLCIDGYLAIIPNLNIGAIHQFNNEDFKIGLRLRQDARQGHPSKI